MTITGQIGHLGIGKQSSQVTEANLSSYTPTITDWFVMTDESMTPNESILITEGEIGRGRDRTGAVPGGYGISGGFEGYARSTELATLLQAGLRQTLVTQSGDTVTSFTPENYTAWWSIEKNVGDTLYLWYVNCKLNNLTISASAGEIATFSSEWVASMERDISDESTSLYGSPSYSGDDVLVFHGGKLDLGGTQYNNMESVEVAISNGLSDDEYTVQPSRFLNDITEGERTFDLSFSQVFQSAADYATYTYGGAGRTTPGYNLYEQSVTFILMNAQTKGSATQYVEFSFPKVLFGGLPVTLTTGRVVVDNTGTVLAPTSGSIVTVEYK